MKKEMILILLLLVPMAIATDYSNRDSLRMDINIGSDFTLIREPGASINYMAANLTFFPRSTLTQNIITLTTNPSSTREDSYIYFKWDSPEENNLSYNLHSIVKVTDKTPKITKKIKFPVESQQHQKYTKPSTYIDSNHKEVIKLANALAAGDSDLYSVVFEIAKWVEENIKYDLTTSTEKVVQKASWVLEKRYGVCDELTNLFIALLRSLNIPAKYISGMAYTNINDKWGPHAWAEVYIDNAWIPFDVTYNQFGFIDVSHIKLKESIDSDESTTNYEWKAYNVDIKTKELNITVNEIQKGNIVPTPFKFELYTNKETVGLGSYNLLEARIVNKENYYLPITINVANTDQLTIEGENRKHILLKPGQEKSFYWIIKVSDELSKGFIYTFPVQVYSAHINSTVNFTSQHGEIMLTREDISGIISQKYEEETKQFSKDIELDCTVSPTEFYIYETHFMTCNIANKGNVELKNLNLCFKHCEKLNLTIGQTKEHSFPISFNKTGKDQFKITIKNKDVSKASYVEYFVLDEPLIEINNLDFPTEVEFNQEFDVNFRVEKQSLSNPYNLTILFNKEEVLLVDQLSKNKDIKVKMIGKELGFNENIYNVTIKYTDKYGNNHLTSEQVKIKLVNLTFFQKIYIFLSEIIEFFKNI